MATSLLAGLRRNPLDGANDAAPRFAVVGLMEKICEMFPFLLDFFQILVTNSHDN